MYMYGIVYEGPGVIDFGNVGVSDNPTAFLVPQDHQGVLDNHKLSNTPHHARARLTSKSWCPQHKDKPTLWEDILMPGSDLIGERSPLPAPRSGRGPIDRT